jgi:hypothetical protein
MVPFFTIKALTVLSSVLRSGPRFFVLTSGGGSVQGTNRNRIKLLVTLVLFTMAVTSTWWASHADARGLSSPGTSGVSIATRPGASLACGDPDGSQHGVEPPPPPTTKQAKWLPGGPKAGGMPLNGWIQWTGRIWATLRLRTL